MTTMSTVGYGDLTAVSDSERLFSILAMVIGGAYYGYAVGTICSVVANRDLNVSAYHDRMDTIYAWLNHHNLDPDMRRRIIRYFKGHLTEKAAVEEADVLKDLSPALQKEVGERVIPEDIRNNPVFDKLPPNAVFRLQKIVKKTHIDEGQVLVQAGEAGIAMFIVATGMVRLDLISEDGRELPSRALSVGDSFGEEILVGLEEKYDYTVVATTKHASLHMIEEQAFHQLFEHMPDVKAQILRNATELYGAIRSASSRAAL